MRRHLFTLTLLAMVVPAQPRLSERRLADYASLRVPAGLKLENAAGTPDESGARLTFSLSSTYFWASFMSAPAYRQLLVVSLMAHDASGAEYAAWPRRFTISYEQRRQLQTRPIGTGTLTVFEGTYSKGTLVEPAWEFRYSDPARRLQLAWHVVRSEVDLEGGVAAVTNMAASFRLLREPALPFAAMRAAPALDAAARAERVATARAMVAREGFGAPQPGTPVVRDSVYFEWMEDPEVRYQLVVPLGRVRVPANAQPGLRPRPAPRRAELAGLPGIIGWYEYVDGAWQFSNQDNDYLPFAGIAAQLASQARDPAYVYFQFIGTVRVAEESREERLRAVRWFLDAVPEVRRRWRTGALVVRGVPEPETPDADTPDADTADADTPDAETPDADGSASGAPTDESR